MNQPRLKILPKMPPNYATSTDPWTCLRGAREYGFDRKVSRVLPFKNNALRLIRKHRGY
jgi:hypothetical protein